MTKARKGTARDRLRYMVLVAMFMAMTYVTMLLLRIKVPPFLTLDVKDTVTTLCGLFLGPIAALMIAVAVPLLEFFVSDTGFYGLIMNTLGSVTFCVTVALFYKWKKSIWSAVVGLVTAALLMTGVMLVANTLITPHYLALVMNMPLPAAKEAVRTLIPPTILPFNLLKGFLNVGLVLLLYKPLSRVLHKTGVLSKSKTTAAESTEKVENSDCSVPHKSNLTSIVVTAVAVMLITVAAVLIFTVMKGSIGG
jgi:riboflavin transporter FmnP